MTARQGNAERYPCKCTSLQLQTATNGSPCLRSASLRHCSLAASPRITRLFFFQKSLMLSKSLMLRREQRSANARPKSCGFWDWENVRAPHLGLPSQILNWMGVLETKRHHNPCDNTYASLHARPTNWAHPCGWIQLPASESSELRCP
jgi:hypothetical protein